MDKIITFDGSNDTHIVFKGS